MPEFFIDLFRARDRVGNFFPQQLAVALPHPLRGGFHGRLVHRELIAELRVRAPARLTWLVILQQFEQCALVARHELLA